MGRYQRRRTAARLTPQEARVRDKGLKRLTVEAEQAERVRRIAALRRQLGVARGQIATLEKLLRPTDGAVGAPDRFVHCWTTQRGAYSVVQALDGTGQVWELHSVFDPASKKITEQFWTPLGMERRQP